MFDEDGFITIESYNQKPAILFRFIVEHLRRSGSVGGFHPRLHRGLFTFSHLRDFFVQLLRS